MQVDLPFKRKFSLKNIGRLLIFKLIYLVCFLNQWFKKLFCFKKTALVMIVLLFAVFSSLKTSTPQVHFLNQFSKEEKIFVEKGLAEKETNKDSLDFQAAAWREDQPIDLNNEEEIYLILNNSILVAPETDLNPEDILRPTRTEIETYLVQPGDTISTIAQKFGLQWNTILWENNLNYWSVIRPGDKLKILPVNGITHQVKSGETLSSLAKKYNSAAEKIALFNNLETNSILSLGEKLIIPDGTPPPAPKPVYTYTPPTPQITSENYASYSDWRRNTKCHRFVINQCTDWSAFKWATEQGQCVPSWSHAKYWFGRAQKDGYETGSQPKQGAIMSLTCTSWICGYYGHVAYVENFDAETVTISEMNGLKKNAYSSRTLKNITGQWQNGWKILGYIYPIK